jgi:tRNA1(Val) A37 N6-methylase TrmN6
MLSATRPYYGAHSSGAIGWLRRVARQESEEGIAGWLQAANRFLRPNGTVTLIYPVERLQEVLDGLARFAGRVIIYPLWPQQGAPAKRMLVTGEEIQPRTLFDPGRAGAASGGRHLDAGCARYS